MKISVELKLRVSPEDKKLLISAMKQYTALIRYGIKTLRPNLDDKKEIYGILTEKFPSMPARTTNLAVEQDISAIINSFSGLEAKNFPLSMRFDKDNSHFFIENDRVKLKMAVDRPQKGKLTSIIADVMPKRDLTYKYYLHLFTTKKEYNLPFKLIMRNGQIYSKVSVEKEALLATSTKPHINVGIDLNAFWVKKKQGNPMAVAFVNDEGKFVRQPLLLQEWASIPQLIRANQKKGNVNKVVTNQLGLIIKRLLELTKDYQPTFKVEDLLGLNRVKGAYSKFFYRKFLNMLRTKSLDVHLINPAYTSQTCSRCGKRGRAQKRTFYCDTCYPQGTHRDINAAINIAKS